MKLEDLINHILHNAIDKDIVERLEPITTLDPKWENELKRIQNEGEKILNRSNVLEAERKLFWAKLKEHTGVFDKHLRLEDNILFEVIHENAPRNSEEIE